MHRNAITIGLLALGAASQLSALTLTFTDRGTWASQVTSLTNFDGGTQAVGTSSGFYTSAGLALTDLQIVGYNVNGGTSYDLQRANANGVQPWYNWNSGAIIRSGDKIASNTVFARITFTNPVSAFGFNFGAGGTGGAASVTVSAGGLAPVNVSTTPQPAFAFWGVASNSQTFTFADVYINDTGRYLVLDDIAHASYSAAAAPEDVAEPGTLLQIALGGILLAMARRKFSFISGQAA
jgi:hypothetical protein